MATKNLILEILEENNIQELFVEEEHTELTLEDWIACPKNPENNKEQMIPLTAIIDWVAFLKDLPDVVSISNVESGLNNVRGSGKDLRVSLTLSLQGALKNPKKNLDFERVFLPIRDTLITILSKRLSFSSFLESQAEAVPEEEAPKEETPSEEEPLEEMDTELAGDPLS